MDGADPEECIRAALDCGLRIHQRLGPGLLESVYEQLLADCLQRSGFFVERQKPLDFEFDGIRFIDGFRADLLINLCLIIEIKAVERLAMVHTRQMLTYLRIMEMPLGLILNFGGATFKEGIKRVVNNHAP